MSTNTTPTPTEAPVEPQMNDRETLLATIEKVQREEAERRARLEIALREAAEAEERAKAAPKVKSEMELLSERIQEMCRGVTTISGDTLAVVGPDDSWDREIGSVSV